MNQYINQQWASQQLRRLQQLAKVRRWGRTHGQDANSPFNPLNPNSPFAAYYAARAAKR